ncbi:MAG: helix-hairpin-helix domain-containing protein, partial [Thermodesulfobacteriota bacterium]
MARFQLKGRRSSITIVGNLVDTHPGEELRVTGRWTTHRVYGEQLRVESYLSLIPATVKGIEKYLGSGLIKGIGPVMARRLVQHFGVNTLGFILEDGERLQEVEGIGKERAQGVREAWLAQRGIRDVMIFLQGHGVSAAYAAKIYQQYGSQAAGVVKENPYRLATEVVGIGFKMADQIAQNLGIDPQSPLRAQAGILYLLKELSSEGHICYPQEGEVGNERGLIERGQEILGLEAGVIAKAINTLQETGRVVVDERDHSPCYRNTQAYEDDHGDSPHSSRTAGNLVYLPEFHWAEVEVASRYWALARMP